MRRRLPFPLEFALRAYPSRFRDTHGAELRDVIATQADQARSKGRWAWRIYAAALVDLLINLPLEWWATLRPPTDRRLFDTLGRDLRLAIRRLARAPGFTSAAALSLAVGVCASTMVFSLVRTVLLDPLPYPDAEQLVAVWESRNDEFVSVAWPNFRDWQETVATADLAVFGRDNVNVTGDGPAQRLRGLLITPNLFDILGVTPHLGRTPSALGEVALTHAVWASRYGSDRDILNRTVLLNGTAWTVVGVLPTGIQFPDGLILGPSDLFFLLDPTAEDYQDRGSHPGLTAIARMHDGVSIDELRAELEAVAVALTETYPDTNQNSGVMLAPAARVVAGDMRRPIAFLAGAVLLLLLAAVGNVAGLGLTRTAGQAREWGVRSALGASRLRVVGQIGIEYVLIGGLASGLGLAASVAILPKLAAWPPIASIGVVNSLGAVDLWVGLAIGAVATLFVAVAPLLKALSADSSSLAGVRITAPVRAREILVAGQLALAMVLLVAASTLGRSMMRIYAEDGGIRPESLSAFRVSLPEADYPTGEQALAFFDELTGRLAAVPGIASVSGISTLPFSGAGSQSGIRSVDFPDMDPVRTDVNVVMDQYFETAGVQLLSGRFLDSSDHADAPTVVVVDERFASRLWPDQDPLGRAISGWGFQSAEVVGVVRHVKNYGVTRDSREELYVSHRQRPYTSMWVMARGELGTGTPATMVRDVVARIDPNIPIASVSRMDDVVKSTISSVRLAAALGLTLAGVIAFLALVGLRSTIAYSVHLRVREFGIRMALGSESGQIRRGVLSRSMIVAGIGVGAGVGIALLTSATLEGLVFGIPKIDFASYLAAASVIGLVALAAGDGPARQASRCDPAVTLREE